ncbi:hypothetical protein E1295_22275 [Nonomuraea mesophila]|uniref:Uncharacterized protein n=1 Tax=Nonomuraea mesophila TaxID=2530382 RepID=A0A4R5FEP3_9ACTN|nr:hypothetical protein [Nonomuraea mesophila]TDE47869.1 hypothetical protein E1295_22275 [Nonomuraea mesophila]
MVSGSRTTIERPGRKRWSTLLAGAVLCVGVWPASSQPAHAASLVPWESVHVDRVHLDRHVDRRDGRDGSCPRRRSAFRRHAGKPAGGRCAGGGVLAPLPFPGRDHGPARHRFRPLRPRLVTRWRTDVDRLPHRGAGRI